MGVVAQTRIDGGLGHDTNDRQIFEDTTFGLSTGWRRKMLGVTKFVLKGDYAVYLEFNDGQSGVIDFKDELENDHREVVRELLDPEKFKTVKLGHHTLCWDNGVDFAPEYLYEQNKKQQRKIA
jgi:hypothetical protein